MARNLAGTSIPPGNGGVTFPSPHEWPNAVRLVSNITISPQATVTSYDHGFTNSQDSGKTIVGFHNIKGMIQINGIKAYVGNVINGNNFTILLDTSLFSAFINYESLQLTWADCAPSSQFFDNGLTWAEAQFPWSGLAFGGEALIIAGHSPYDPFTNILP